MLASHIYLIIKKYLIPPGQKCAAAPARQPAESGVVRPEKAKLRSRGSCIANLRMFVPSNLDYIKAGPGAAGRYTAASLSLVTGGEERVQADSFRPRPRGAEVQ